MTNISHSTPQNGIALLNTSAPFSSSNAKDSIDLALIFGSYELAPSLFFFSDGVLQLIDNIDGDKISIKDFTKTFSALEFYDIEQVYVCEESLKQRGLSKVQLIENVEVLSNEQFSQKLASHKQVLKF